MMNLKALRDYLKECKEKRTVPTVPGLKQFYRKEKAKYSIS